MANKFTEEELKALRYARDICQTPEFIDKCNKVIVDYYFQRKREFYNRTPTFSQMKERSNYQRIE